MIRLVAHTLTVICARVSRRLYIGKIRAGAGEKDDGSQIIGIGNRSGAVAAEPHAGSIRVQTPSVSIDADTATHCPTAFRRPRETDARQENLVVGRFESATPVVGRKPDRPRSVGLGVCDGWIEDAHVIVFLAPSILDLIAEPEVNREIRQNLEVVLNEELRAFLPRCRGRLVVGAPSLHLSQQKVRITQPASRRVRTALGEDAGKSELPGLHVPPWSRIILIGQEFSTEMQNMLAADHGHHVGRLKAVLNIDCVRLRVQDIIASRPIDCDIRKDIGFRILKADLLRVPQPDTLRNEPITLPGVSKPKLINNVWTDRPYVRDLRIVAIDVAGLAIDGTARVGVEGWVVALGNREYHVILVADVVIDSAKLLYERIHIRLHVLVVVAEPGEVRVGVVGLEGGSHFVEAVRRNLVAGERRPDAPAQRGGIVDFW